MPGRFRVRWAISGAAGLCSLFLAAASLAADLTDVRVGPHGDYTRVVLQTDAKAAYSLNQTADAVTIELRASATPKAVTAKSQQLSWVRVEPQGDSTIVRIELKGPARVKQMVLSAPSRIVLDVYGDANAARASAAAPPQAAPAAPAIAARASATPSPLDDEAALVQREADALLGPAADAVPGDELAATEGSPSEGGLSAEGDAAASEVPIAEPTPAPLPRVEVVKHEGGLLDWLQNPYVLGCLAIVMAALVVILRLRRPLAKKPAQSARPEESAASLFAPAQELPADTETIVVGEPSAELADEEPADAELARGDATTVEERGSPFEFEPPEVDPEKPDIGRAQGATLSTIASVTSTAAYETQAPIATGGLNMAELERRLALLEQRLEEVIDAKDRLERQVSAQTEELRVQRAAIARTQRVLRTVVRPEDDQPSEPVLKS